MGLLDFSNEDEDDFLPNFNSSWAPPQTTEAQLDTAKSNSSDSGSSQTGSQSKGYRHRSSTTSTSASKTSDSHSAAKDSSTDSSSSSSSSSSKRPPVRGAERRRTRGMSFDLFGDDEELQKAESTIKFCDICLKHCDRRCMFVCTKEEPKQTHPTPYGSKKEAFKRKKLWTM